MHISVTRRECVLEKNLYNLNIFLISIYIFIYTLEV